MIAALVVRIVMIARGNAVLVTLGALLVAGTAGYYAAGHLSIDTDVEHMLPASLPWRANELALDQAFPQNADLLAIVIDGRTPDLADSAAAALADRLRAEPTLFRTVRRPDGGPFFERNGLLFLPVDQLQTMSQQLIQAQPLIGSLAQDPSLRGLFNALGMFVQGAESGAMPAAALDPALTTINGIVRGVLDGKPQSLSWQQMLTGRPPEARELRRFVLTQPVLDFAALEPGDRAQQEVRRIAAALNLDAATGVRVRETGPVALNDEEFATLREGAARSTILSIVSVCVLLFAALRSVKLVGAILTTIVAGLLLTAGFAAAAIGSLNLISVAFAVLFVGLAVDFSIQFSVRFRDQRHRLADFSTALRATAAGAGGALVLAAAATAIGFLSFVPTQYAGIRELGVIAGAGMVIAITLNFTLLPALLTLLRPRGEREAIGFRRAAPLDHLLISRRIWIRAAAAILAIGGLALLPHLTFDFNPLDLNNPHAESVSTLFDMMSDPNTTPYTGEVMTPSLAAAEQLSKRLSALPEVAQVVTAAGFVPEDQPAKLGIISDLSLLLGPTLSPIATLPPPDDAAVLKAMVDCRDALRRLAEKTGPDSPPAQLEQAVDQATGRGPAIIPALRQALLAGLNHQLDQLRESLQAAPVTLDSLPDDLRHSWIAADGRARVEIFPKGDARDNAVLARFVAALRRVAPDVTGTPVTIEESGRTISNAFVEAGAIAFVAITILLTLVLRRARDVALVIAPLALAAILTLAATVLLGMPLNYANIVALPLLLGIGVAFDIYFVMNWRAGVTNHLQSSTARAVIFSALTTMMAFGSLALSNHPGTADMGKLLSLSLAFILFCTLLVLPALLGPAPIVHERERRPAARVVAKADRSR